MAASGRPRNAEDRKHPHPVSWDEIGNQLERWKNMHVSLGIDDDTPPSEQTLRHASDFTRQAAADDIAIPTPQIFGDGEVGFRWTTPTSSSSVCFLPDGNVVAYVSGKTTPQRFEVDRPYILGKAEDIIRAVQAEYTETRRNRAAWQSPPGR